MKVFYFDADWNLTERGNAVIAKVFQDDGTIDFLVVPPRARAAATAPTTDQAVKERLAEFDAAMKEFREAMHGNA